jgi:glycosyltransferase involved in cell wall biosynthesis
MASEPSDRDRPYDYSIVVPVYRNEATLRPLVERLTALQAKLPGELELLFVIDGSPDSSVLVLRELLATASFGSQLISLSRNFGAFSAIRMGLSAARGRLIAVMAADMQEPPELVEQFFAQLDTGNYDVAVGTRSGRNDPALSAFASRLFWGTYRRFIQPDVPRGGVDIFGCTAQVRDSLVQLRESHSSLIGLLFWLGFRRVEVPYVRAPREDGRSGWSFRRRLKYLLDSTFSFTDLPITLLIALGAVAVAVSVVISVAVFIAWATGKIGVAGYTPLMLTLMMFSSVLVLGLGLVGSYVWRTYENSKGRPDFVPMLIEEFDGNG